MKKIKLTKKELDFLKKTLISSDKKSKYLVMSSVEYKNGNVQITISIDNADYIRDFCEEQLQLIGFDKNYQLTEEGKILESLSDKFFIG